MKKRNAVHADMCDELGKSVPACGKTYEVGLGSRDLFVWHETFAAFVCGADEEKCEDCEKEMRRRAA